MKKYCTDTTVYLLSIMILLLLFTPASSQSGTYHSYKELENKLEQLADEYPALIDLQSQEQSLGKRAILAVTLTSGKADNKPGLLILAGVSGTDIAGSEVCMQIIESLAGDYGKIDSVTRMLDETAFYIFPRVNPDASEAYFSKPQYARMLNKKSLDLDQDGKIDEDGYDDLNKDGYITWMRITEPGGEWCDDSEYPGLLKKADAAKGETGIYRLISEGFDNDGDGVINEDEPGGVNFNQNFTYNYKFFEKGAGMHQISEMESRAVADFAFAHENIVAVFSFSPNDNLIHPWEAGKGSKPKADNQRQRAPVENVDAADAPYYVYISDKFKAITGFDDLPKSESGAGAFNEWAYFHFGRWSFSTPTWWPPIIKPVTTSDSAKADSGGNKSNDKSSAIKDDLQKSPEQRLWDWMQYTNRQDAFIPWTEFKHPDFPDNKVEIGCFKPFFAENPPADSLTAIAQKFRNFLGKLSSLLPRIDVENLKVENLHNNVYRISLAAINRGYLPTTTQIGVENKWCPKIKLAIQLSDGQKLAGGRILQFIDHLTGSGGSEEISWVVLGKPGETVKIAIGSPMTGTILKSVKLQ